MNHVAAPNLPGSSTAGVWPARTPSGPLARAAAWLVALLVGTDKRMMARRTLCLLAAFIYGFWNVLLLGYAVPNGLVSHQVAWFFVVYNLVAMLGFYPLVRSPLTRNWSDPGLVAPQILLASGAMVLSYVVAPVVRPGAFQTLCLIQVFGFLSLRPRLALKVGLAVVAMLCAAWGYMALSGARNVDPRAEAFKMAVACVDLLVLTMQSRRFAVLRDRTHHEKRALADAAARLQFITCHDGLTGLCNRAHMDTLLRAEVQRLQVKGPGFSVALVDLDHFKRINDSLGHQAGDAVLVAFAQQATGLLRETDVVSRWGGEEFLILMPDTMPGDNAAVALNRLHQRLAAAPIMAADEAVTLRFSCGIAPWEPGLSIDQLLDRADRALYRAKHGGRNQTVVWGD